MNDSEVEGNEDSSHIAATPSSDTSQQKVNNIDLHLDVLTAEEKDFRRLEHKNDKRNRKIILTFLVKEPDKRVLTLVAWSSKNHKFEQGSQDTVILRNDIKSDANFTDKRISFENLKIHKNLVSIIFNKFTDDENDEIIVFDPKRKLDNPHVYYDIYIFPKSSFKDLKYPYEESTFYLGSTNPSPPASSDPDLAD